ncbi:ABC transporter ATP-binding protein [Staphylococcus chromogenes]|nr:ABC transporter ATP-binding protein [Staphylococcus chromogenes]PTF74832.1 ABC transporter ATP-binding protein [Staphylococcus chromogenes]PTG77369.1 ABC transporter ATP-binding protein [Staphylococcus chromogenes]RIM14499.1 ABC transporter ATP-binding protein [Staphylococcus chromogenes]
MKGVKVVKNNNLIFIIRQIHWPILLIIGSTVIVSIGSLLGLIVPILTARLVDSVPNEGINVKFILMFIGVFFLNIIMSGIGLYFLSKIGGKVVYSLRNLLWRHIIQLEIPFFDKHESGRIMSRILEDTGIINNFISLRLPSLLPSLLTLFGSIVVLIYLDWKMTLVIFVTVPIYLVCMIPLGKLMQKISYETQKKTSEFSGNLSKILNEIRLIKLSTKEEKELQNSNRNLKDIYLLGLKQAKIFSILEPISGIMIIFFIAVILGIGGIRVSQGDITSGTLVAIVFYVIQLAMPLSDITTLITDYNKSKGASIRIAEILQTKKENLDKGTLDIQNSKDIIFKNVTFRYNQQVILKNISFRIPSGKTTAIVGPSGSGKTTIFNLLSRLYNLEERSGEILYGNESIENFNLRKWRQDIGYVTQSNAIINGTIKENIVYSVNENISDEIITKAAKEANIHNAINNMDKGYNSMVGEKGVKLSGGERQRIDIARNFIKNPNLLLLDEVTSNLDSESEYKIQESLKKLMKGKTTIIIAHRLTTIREADNIVFLDNGIITGIGDHNSLLRSHDKYKSFIEKQTI